MGLRTPRQHRVLLGFIVILLILSFLPAIAAALETTTFSIDDSVQGVGPNQFNYIGTGWRHCMVNCGNSFYNKTISWTTTLNDSVTLLFSGTQLKFYGGVNTAGGQASIGIDSTAPVIIDFYAPQPKGNVLLWTSSTLADGPHSLYLRALNTHQLASQGTGVTVDRVDVLSPSLGPTSLSSTPSLTPCIVQPTATIKLAPTFIPKKGSSDVQTSLNAAGTQTPRNSPTVTPSSSIISLPCPTSNAGVSSNLAPPVKPTNTPTPTPGPRTLVVNRPDDHLVDGACNQVDCTLREAVKYANSGDTVTFAPSALPTITLLTRDSGGTCSGTWDIVVDKTLTITGPGASQLTVTNASNSGTTCKDRIFEVTSTGNLTVSGLTLANAQPDGEGRGGAISSVGTLQISDCVLTNNFARLTGGAIYNGFNSTGVVSIRNSTISNSRSPDGGGIYNDQGGIIIITNSTISGNGGANFGGGIYNAGGTLTIINSTISGNSASGQNGTGGGILTEGGTSTITNSTISGNWVSMSGGGIASGGTLTITNSTISGNSASLSGGGIFTASGLPNGAVNLKNTIVANSSSGGNCAMDNGINIDGGYNLEFNTPNTTTCGFTNHAVNADPKLSPLADNGGATQTMALLSGSAAINAGSTAICLAAPVNGLDQRNYSRTSRFPCSIGAYEYGGVNRQLCTTSFKLVSISPSGTPVNNYAESISVSAGGQSAFYKSFSYNIITVTPFPPTSTGTVTPTVSGPPTSTPTSAPPPYIYKRNIATSGTTLVSVNSSGALASAYSDHPSASSDGRYVVFESDANNLALPTPDNNNRTDIFLRDTVANTTILVSIGLTGASSHPTLSTDGKWAVFESIDATGYPQIYARDVTNLASTPILISKVNSSAGNDASTSPSVSGPNSQGHHIAAFASSAYNLVSGDTNGYPDIFIYDLDVLPASPTRISFGPGGAQADGASSSPSISADGRYIAFESVATNLLTGTSGATKTTVDIYVYDQQAVPPNNPIKLVSVDLNGGANANSSSYSPSISGPDENHDYYVSFWSDASNLSPGDTEGQTDIFVRDISIGWTARVTAGVGNYSSAPSISSDGACVGFYSAGILAFDDANGQPDVYVIGVPTTTLTPTP